ncbi:MAG: glycoside hydrolase family 125 protein [Clostridia bacterium]|nr:glycoside hydrolase family 125 protein [Clostridia bacterium]
MKIPDILIQKATETEEILKNKVPELAPFFKRCFLNTIETTVTQLDDGSYFVITGDIPAMWLRDSAAQLKPYIRYANEDEALREILRSVIEKHAFYVCLDPYANAFNSKPNKDSHNDETSFYHELIWERKYEVDSLCAPLYLAYEYYQTTFDTSIFTEKFQEMLWKILETFKKEQNHTVNSTYFFNRKDCPALDTLPNEGKGEEVAYTGMTWSGFRPSDDRCKRGYLIPSNMMAVCALKKAAELANIGYEDTKLESECRSLAFDIDEGIKDYGVIENDKFGKMFAYETDGKGNYVLMDDANSPSLLSAPYLGYVKPANEIYQNTRRFILSGSNPWYFEGSAAKGVGSPHTGYDKIWHISLSMQALTSTNPDEIKECIKLLTTTDNGTGLMHESFHKNDPSDFTRPWFAWSNSLFAELMIRIANGTINID